MQNDEFLSNIRHSCAHLLAAAILELWPGSLRAIGPSTEDGFYYDFDFDAVKGAGGAGGKVSESDFSKIEQKMREILKKWDKFERIEVSADKAKKEFKGNPYKFELIDEFTGRNELLTLYKSGDYIDLCRGGHSENPATDLKHFKLISVAGAYWRGSEKNKMLTRIYGTCFLSKEELDQYLWQLEEAKKRDHRKIGQEQKLFFIDEMVGKGLIVWLPNGTIIKNEIEKLAIEMESQGGYVRVTTPHLAKEELYLKSGHLPYYKDSMYPAMKMDDGTYYIKPMNCPHHHLVYLNEIKSYRDLPVRLAEYGTVYRNELSGTLAGLLRVRALSMNDAHIYCRRDQIKDEFRNVMQLTTKYFEIFGLSDYWFRLSKWSPEHLDKYVNEPDNWNYSESVLREVLEEMKVKFIETDNEAAFYGPKVDAQFKSVVGREETMSTIQLDFVAKKRFNLTYIDDTGRENNEVFVIHRAPLSTHERFMAFLIEHFAGIWPVWLSPVQVLIAPVSEKFRDFAALAAQEFKEAGIRAELDDRNESVSKKIRDAEVKKTPYIIVLGEKEKQGAEWMVRQRGVKDQYKITKTKFIAKILDEIRLF